MTMTILRHRQQQQPQQQLRRRRRLSQQQQQQQKYFNQNQSLFKKIIMAKKESSNIEMVRAAMSVVLAAWSNHCSLLHNFMNTTNNNHDDDENDNRCDVDNMMTNGHKHHHRHNHHHNHHHKNHFNHLNHKSANHLIRLRWQQLARNAFHHYCMKKQQQQQHEQSIKMSDNKCNNNDDDINMKLIDHNDIDNDVIVVDDKTMTKFNLLEKNLIDLITFTTNPNNLNTAELFDHQWIQLSGHEDSFALAGPGTIWKKHTSDSTEIDVYEALSMEPISEMIPKFYRNVQYKGDNFIELEDLLYTFKDASIMDIKMGTRTFLESEVNNSKLRNDLYEKMLRLDSNQLTADEHRTKSVTKLRYMMFRENLSSTSNLGFRIEGYKVGDNVKHNKNLHTIKSELDVQKILETFFQSKHNICREVLLKLRLLRKYFESSKFFNQHEIIGSSILIIYTAERAGVWMIDFAKTLPIPEHCQIDHRSKWYPGNHEDGYLYGLDNLIQIITNYLDGQQQKQLQNGHQ